MLIGDSAGVDYHRPDNDKRRGVVFGFPVSESSLKFLDVSKHRFQFEA